MSNKSLKTGIALSVIAYLFLSMMMLTSCTGSRLSKGAGCQNGYVGYGEKTHVVKGSHRKSF